MRRSGFGLRWLAGPAGAGIEGSVLKSRCRRQRRLRAWFVGVAVTAGVVVRIPDGSGCGRRDALAAVEAATAAITSRFGAAGLLGVVTPVRVAVAASSGRLLAPGWPWAPGRGEAG